MPRTATRNSTALTARDLYNAAACVRGARSAGITTATSEAAPEMLARAEAILAKMAKGLDFDIGAPSLEHDIRASQALKKVLAYKKAVDDLRAALNGD